jgi:hypothetical protein
MNSNLIQRQSTDEANEPSRGWKTTMHFDDELFLRALVEAVKGTYAPPEQLAVAVAIRPSHQELTTSMSANSALASSSTAATVSFS